MIRTTLNLSIALTVLLCASVGDAGEALAKMTQRVEMFIQFDSRAGKSTPVQVDVDFSKLLGSKSAQLIDPYTLIVNRQTGKKSKVYNVRFSEQLLYKNQGWIAWLVDEPKKASRWTLEFRLRSGDGRMAKPKYLPAVGVGDELAYNGLAWRPIDSPGYHPHPIPVDWNGDGLVDILSRSHGANRFGMPMASIFYWRNIGTNKNPKYAPPLRLYANGVTERQSFLPPRRFPPRKDFISEDYIDCDVFDWFGTGHPDLITMSRSGRIRVYRNAGKLDRVGLPILKMAKQMEFPSCLAPGRYPCLRVMDWDGTKRPSLMLGTMWKGQLDGRRQYRRQIVLMRVVGGSKGNWKFQSVPLGRPGRKTLPQRWQDYSNFENERPFYFDVYDIDSDGKKELLCSRRTDVVPAIEVWRNVGTSQRPVMKFDRELPWFTHDSGFSFRFVSNKAFRGCLISSVASGWGMKYFEQVSRDVFKLGAFHDRGQLVGLAAELKLQAYVRPFPFDADGDGDMDLLCGDEPGHLTLVRNVGTKLRPAFAAPETVKSQQGVPLTLSDTVLHPRSRSKTYIGQIKPFVCDWDSDGNLDVIVSGGTFDDIYWLKKYNPLLNRYDSMTRLKVRGNPSPRPFQLRKGPAVVDWDGDGTPELLAVAQSDKICRFRQHNKRSPNVLTKGEPLLYQNGKPLTIKEFLPYGNITLWPCDWTGSQASDLIVASNHFVWLVENVGTNKKPVFKTPVRFTDPKGMAIEVSHHESHAASYDWDGDGRLDLMVGGESGTIYMFHRDWLNGITHSVKFRQ